VNLPSGFELDGKEFCRGLCKEINARDGVWVKTTTSLLAKSQPWLAVEVVGSESSYRKVRQLIGREVGGCSVVQVQLDEAAVQAVQQRTDDANTKAQAAAATAAAAAQNAADEAAALAAAAQQAAAAAATAQEAAAAALAAEETAKSSLRLEADKKLEEAAAAAQTAREAAERAAIVASVPVAAPVEAIMGETFSVNIKLQLDGDAFKDLQASFSSAVCQVLGASAVEVTEVTTSLLARGSVWVKLNCVGTPTSQARSRWLLNQALSKEFEVSEFSAVFPASVRITTKSTELDGIADKLCAVVQGACVSKDVQCVGLRKSLFKKTEVWYNLEVKGDNKEYENIWSIADTEMDSNQVSSLEAVFLLKVRIQIPSADFVLDTTLFCEEVCKQLGASFGTWVTTEASLLSKSSPWVMVELAATDTSRQKVQQLKSCEFAGCPIQDVKLDGAIVL